MKQVVAKLGEPLHAGRLFSSALPGREKGIIGTGNLSEVLPQGMTAVAPSKNFRRRVTQGLLIL